jgi:hypothetical protein
MDFRQRESAQTRLATFALYSTAKELIPDAADGFRLVVNRKVLGERNVFEGRLLGPDN